MRLQDMRLLAIETAGELAGLAGDYPCYGRHDGRTKEGKAFRRGWERGNDSRVAAMSKAVTPSSPAGNLPRPLSSAPLAVLEPSGADAPLLRIT